MAEKSENKNMPGRSLSRRVFLDPSSPLLPQYLIIAATMVAVDMAVMTGYTSLASRVLSVMRSRRQQVVMNRTFAALFFVAASFLATIRRTNAI